TATASVRSRMQPGPHRRLPGRARTRTEVPEGTDRDGFRAVRLRSTMNSSTVDHKWSASPSAPKRDPRPPRVHGSARLLVGRTSRPAPQPQAMVGAVRPGMGDVRDTGRDIAPV